MSVTITMQLDEDAAAALATVIRAAAPEDYGADPKAWYRAIDQLSPQLPATPTRDERDGMAWWNALTEDRRAYWLREAKTAIVAEAWAEFKRRGRPRDGADA
jgi:hypothetical protein